MLKTFLRSTVMAGALAAVATTASSQTLDIAVGASPAGLDPHIVTAFASFLVVNGTIYEGLTAIDPDLRVVPGLAESWTVSDDGKTVTFTLRQGVTFHDGSAMTAADVVSTIARVKSDTIASPLASRLASVVGAAANDDHTVTLTLSEASAPLMASLATIAIVPAEVEGDPDTLQQTPIGTGPFQFDEWQPNGYILLAKNESYWAEGEPKLDGVRYNIVPEASTQQVGLLNGQYSMLPNIGASTALQIQGNPGIKLAETLELSYTVIGLNTARAPLDNPKVREAINYAIDREEVIAAALFGAGQPAGPLSPALTEWALPTSAFPCYAHDTDKAKALLAEAGVDPAEVTLTINVLPRQDIIDISQVVQAQLAEAGFSVELNNQEIGQFVQDWRNKTFDMFGSANAGGVDPDQYFYRTFRTGGSTNVFGYSNEQLDTLLDTAQATTDHATRKAMYDEVQQILACTGPIVHIAYGTLYTAMRDNVEGFDIIADRSLSSLRRTSVGQ